MNWFWSRSWIGCWINSHSNSDQCLESILLKIQSKISSKISPRPKMKNFIAQNIKLTPNSWKIFFLQTPKKCIFDFGIHKLPIFIKNSILKFKKLNWKKHIKNKHFWSVFLNWKFFEISIFANFKKRPPSRFSKIPFSNFHIKFKNFWC